MNNLKTRVRTFVTTNIVVLVFAVICMVGFALSGLAFAFYVNDIMSRLARNTFLVLALIIPVWAGMGLNFAIVLGAMGGQFALVAVTHWQLGGLGGVLVAMALALPVNFLFGYLTGRLLNRTKGREMIAGLILAFFALGIYQLIFLVFIGTLIPMNNTEMVLSTGIGLRTTIDIGRLKYGLDNTLKISFSYFILIVGLVLGLVSTFRTIRAGKKGSEQQRGRVPIALLAVGILLVLWGVYLLIASPMLANLNVPLFTYLLIVLLCLFITFIQRTKMGQDFRTVGHDQQIANVSGISVDKVRLRAIIISTVLAGWGQIIFIQNLGIFSTYGAHEQVGLFAVASILIGGASITKANIGHAIQGTFIFHTLFIISPLAAQTLFGNAQVGEYFRVFLAYGIIGVALAMYAWKKAALGRAASRR